MYVFLLITAFYLWTYMYNLSKRSFVHFAQDYNIRKQPYKFFLELSGYPIFKYFLNEHFEKKREDLTIKITSAHLQDKFNANSFYTMKMFIFLVCMYVASTVYIFSDTILNMYMLKTGLILSIRFINLFKLIILCLILLIVILPDAWLSSKYKQSLKTVGVDTLSIQLYIILMLSSKKSVSDILSSLSKMNTKYDEVFEQSTRIYMRNATEGLDYIKNEIRDNSLAKVLDILKSIGDYSNESIIAILNNTVKEMAEVNKNLNRRSDLSKMVYASPSILFPMIDVVIFGLAPVIIYFLQLLQSYII